MSDAFKIALMLAVTALIAMGMFIYFSPFQTCLRADDHANPYNVSEDVRQSGVIEVCARAASGGR